MHPARLHVPAGGATFETVGRTAIRHVLSAVMFFPRGGSAHAARGLARALPRRGWGVTLLSGSRPGAGPDADARAFYRGLDVRPVEPDDIAAGDGAPVAANGSAAWLQPSYEDRPGAAETVFAALDDLDFERHVRAWSAALERAGAHRVDLAHLHHLTPINEAVGRLAPDLPVVGQLHGTELLMLERIEKGPPDSWRQAGRWRERLVEWAHRCRRLLVAPGGLERAARLLELDPARLVPVPNGLDPDLFKPRRVDRAAHWRRHLVAEPLGWAPGRPPGSISYADADLAALRSGVVLVYAGRFTEVKRVPLLIEAFARAQPGFRRPTALVLAGGYPGEWEGEHPAETVARIGVGGVFLAGWHDQRVLPSFLAAADAFVFPSVREQFGQALIEAMASGLPTLAADSFGARAIVEDGETGWIVPGDDVEALAGALIEVVNDDAARARRARAAAAVGRRYSWPLVAERVSEVFEGEARPVGAPREGWREAAEV
jgi:glycosyltransferase involved in cell wall biosynthesis